MTQQPAPEYIDDQMIALFIKNPGWHPAVAGLILIYAARLGRGISVRHNLYKLRLIIQRWIDHIEQDDTKG